MPDWPAASGRSVPKMPLIAWISSRQADGRAISTPMPPTSFAASGASARRRKMATSSIHPMSGATTAMAMNPATTMGRPSPPASVGWCST